MSFVTAQSPALSAAASHLQILGSAMADQNAAAATPTTGVIPAAADEVSALQAMQFSAYGTWYQQVSAQAAAVHQMLVNTLGSSAGAYGETESANQAATGSTSLSGLLSALTGGSSAATGPAQTGGLSSSFGSAIGTPFNWAQNFSAASSDMWDLAQGQFIPQSGSSSAAALGLTGELSTPPPAVAPGPVGGDGLGAMPVSAGVGQASSIGKLSVPPSWAAGDIGAMSSGPAASSGAGWTNTAPQGATVTTLPGGAPSVASAGRGGYGIGAPRYGAKPTVMPKPTVV
ncbi:PPE family protein, SVP subgroup [Mycobacterium sp.]|uniref:PPE family protein, SVP subgroup n=1 Tax=Mycobacterium sp. TaxID=1785 RepID=UPI003C737E97